MAQYSRILVTSALPYANGAIHFGHLAGAYLPADIYVRYQRLRDCDVIYICGSDEHGVSILISASKENVPPKEIIDRYHSLNKEAFQGVGISFDYYGRTSSTVHHQTAQEWFIDFLNKGILKQKVEKQLYDEKAEMFLPDRFVTGTCPYCGNNQAYGDQCENCSRYYKQTELLNPVSLISGETPIIRDAVHWYFPLGDFQEELEKYVASHENDWKDNVLQQVRSWLKTGLTDRPISRDLLWGVKIPLEDADAKVLYVWFEAVLGYISATKEWAVIQNDPERWKRYWCDEGTRYVAFIGKDNIVFHCLMFPSMLMAKGNYILPDNVPANEFLNLEGKKFSKSRNWSIEIKDFLTRFQPDPLRYTLALNMPESRDSDFYWKDFQARNNNELADILGNFVNRTLHFAHKNFQGQVPSLSALTPQDETFHAEFKTASENIAEQYERFRFRDGVLATMNLARTCNKYFNDEEPWKTLKSDNERCGTTINLCIQSIYALAILFEPVLPFASSKLRSILNLPVDAPWTWDSASIYHIPSGHLLGKPEILFSKIDDETIEIEIAKLGEITVHESTEKQFAPLKSQITIDDFTALDLRVGKIISADRVPKSDKLLRLIVDIGFETRQVVAGIGKTYSPEMLTGSSVVFVANLKSVKIFGVESHGMVLAASNEESPPIIVQPTGDISPGSIVK